MTDTATASLANREHHIDPSPSPSPSPNRAQRRHGEDPSPLALALGMAEAAERVGLSRSQLYEEAAEGRLVTRKVGRRRLVLVADLDSWLAALPRA